jgi:N-acetylglucosaminyldiphosphoundecaprenol N-acetyl-beta-D-mannosaminyltransferase
MGKQTPEKRVSVDGFPIDIDAHDDVLEAMDAAIGARSPGHYICITNTESIYHARRLQSHGSYVRGADYSLCDGVGVMIAAMAAGDRVTRYNGPILQLDASRYGVSRGWRHYYLGGTDGSAKEMGRRLTEKFPGMIVAGVYEPPFRPLTAAERAEMIADIKRCKADIVWVGLGLLKQEAMIADLLEEAGVPWMVGVGGSFDYHSGRIPWSPWIVRRVGMEWLFRLIVQPRARAKRLYWSYAWMFGAIGRGMRQRLKGKPSP